jgi:hypothetical protein
LARYLVFNLDGVIARARLDDERAPATCQVLWDRVFPYDGEGLPARHSGTEAGFHFDPTILAPVENATLHLMKGDIVFIRYNERERHGAPDAISEVIWCYGRYNMAISPGKQQHVLGNVFAEFLPGSEAFYAMSERLFTEGAKPLKVAGVIE